MSRSLGSRLAAWAAFSAAVAVAQPGGVSTGGSTQRPITVTGKVALADGRPLPARAGIELYCPPRHQAEGKADVNGGFSVQLGNNRFEGASDASMSTQGSSSSFGGQLSEGRTVNQVDGMSIIALMGCSIRAVLPGYTSDTFDLSRVRVGDVSTNVGTLYLREFSASPENLVSAVGMRAPKEAQKSLAKGRELAAARQFAEAEAEFRKAVKSYPKYADALQELGNALLSQRRPAEARKAWVDAAAADASFPKPLLALAKLSATEQRWQNALEESAAAIKLNSTAYPEAYYYAAVAHYNMSDPDGAMENARRAVQFDAEHAVPLAEQLLGVLYAARGDYLAAAGQYRAYLQHAPGASNSDAVSRLLAEAESRAAQAGRK